MLSVPYEPRHDKNNKMSVRPAKTQISLGIREDSDQIGLESSLGAHATLLVLSCLVWELRFLSFSLVFYLALESPHLGKRELVDS